MEEAEEKKPEEGEEAEEVDEVAALAAEVAELHEVAAEMDVRAAELRSLQQQARCFRCHCM